MLVLKKNLAMAGVTIIVKDEKLGKAPQIPTMLDYRTHVDKGVYVQHTTSSSNLFCIGNIALVEENGGVEGMDKRAKERAALFMLKLTATSCSEVRLRKKTVH